METTFMTIHNFTPEANILFASDSIVDVLGYQPHEVIGRSCFEYFHPDEVPLARGIHDRSIRMEKAAALYYARIQNRDGQWVGCECVFSVVYDVLVACTSIYRGDAANSRRAAEAPAIRRRFASSPKDPRYHMLEHLSAKFRTAPQPALREPRAALFINRFTRTLTIMYASSAVSSVLGISSEQLTGKSFYECIRENCLPDAIRCLESAKANDSIAYLRFWYRVPRRVEEISDEEVALADASQSSDSEDGGVELHGHDSMDVDSGLAGESSTDRVASQRSEDGTFGQETSGDDRAVHSSSPQATWLAHSPTTSGESTDTSGQADQAQRPPPNPSLAMASEQHRQAIPAGVAENRIVPPAEEHEQYELEAVVSCTSDGLVVILRRARPEIPDFSHPAIPPPQPVNGIFAAPWGANPIHPHLYQPDPQHPFHHGLEAPAVPAGGPPPYRFLNSVREIGVFAWSLVGINGNIAAYGHGVPRGEAQPPGGFPIWDPYAEPAPAYSPPENQAAASWAQRDAKMKNEATHQQVYPEQNIRLHNIHDGFAGSGLSSIAQRHMHRGDGGYVFQGPGNWVNNGYENAYGQFQNPSAAGGNAPPTTSAPDEDSGGYTHRWF